MKINILGASGSGVTTLGERLSQELKLNYFDSDRYFWHNTDPPFTTRRDPVERNEQITKHLIASNGWILGGSIIDWGDIFPPFDLIVFLYLPPHIRIERLKKRELERYGTKIYSHPARADQFQRFINWATDYDVNSGTANRTRIAHENWLEKVNAPVLRLGDTSVEDRTDKVIEKLRQL